MAVSRLKNATSYNRDHPLVEQVRQKIQMVTPNLTVGLEIVQQDILSGMAACPAAGYDLVLESNVFNSNEGMETGCCAAFARETVRCLKPEGLAVLVEPDIRDLPVWASLRQTGQLQALAEPGRSAVDLSGIRLVAVSRRLGLRRSDIRVHRFLSAVYAKTSGQSGGR